jgi:molybdate-binding protein
VKETTLWSQQVQIYRTISNNKKDIINRDNGTGICTLIDVAICGHRNVIKKEAEKSLNISTLQ